MVSGEEIRENKPPVSETVERWHPTTVTTVGGQRVCSESIQHHEYDIRQSLRLVRLRDKVDGLLRPRVFLDT